MFPGFLTCPSAACSSGQVPSLALSFQFLASSACFVAVVSWLLLACLLPHPLGVGHQLRFGSALWWTHVWSFALGHPCRGQSPSPTRPSELLMLRLAGCFRQENLAAWRPLFSVGPLQLGFSRPCLYVFVTDHYATHPVAIDSYMLKT